MTTRTCCLCGCLLDFDAATRTCSDCRDDVGDLDNLDGRDESDDDPDDLDPDPTELDPWAARHPHHLGDRAFLDDPDAADAADPDAFTTSTDDDPDSDAEGTR